MNEAELRELAETARALLHLLLNDPAEERRIRARLDDALSLPPDQAGMPLLDALMDNTVLRAWMAERRKPWFRTPPGYLTVDLPEQVLVGSAFSIEVRVTGIRHPLSAEFDRSALRSDRVLTVTVSAPGLQPLGDLRCELLVPASGDSSPVEFGFRRLTPGPQHLVVRAYVQSTFVAEISTCMWAKGGASAETGRREVSLTTMTPVPGEVTMEVSAMPGNRHHVRLIAGGTVDLEASQHLVGEPRQAVENLVAELRRFAEGKSGFSTPAAKRNRLKNLGVDLWRQAVPEAIQQQFWDLGADTVRSFRIVSDVDTLPWELLYPLDTGHDRGFLVDQFPVTRQTGQQAPTPHLPLRSAAFVVSKRAPVNSEKEILRIKELLGAGVPDRGRITSLSEIAATLKAPPGLLHFSCHHDFSEEAGARLRLDEGPFRPTDLATAAALRSLAGAAPIVFFNACRSAGETLSLTQPMGWARQFMEAGAGAFIGTLWPVASEPALAFAEAFYDSLVPGRQQLSTAMSAARDAVSGDDGDPTRLAYTVYGDPNARTHPDG